MLLNSCLKTKYVVKTSALGNSCEEVPFLT